MKTGLESLDTGAPDITYEGNEGPKSPQQMQQMQMAQLQEEYDKYVFEMEEQGLEPMSIQQFIEQALAEGQMSSKGQGGIDNIAMKSGLIDEYRNYKMGQEEAGEQFMSPRDYYRSQEQDRMGVKDGGIMKNVKGQDHMLAYITPGEANTLEDLGGQKTMTPEGIPAYPPPGEKDGPGSGSEGRSPGGGGGERRQANNERFEMAYNPPAQAPTPTFNIHQDTGKPAYEYIGGTKVNIGDVEGKRIAEERDNFVEEPKGFIPRFFDKRAEQMYGMVPNKFSWTYDKRKRYFNSLTDKQKKNLGYNFNKDWDDLTDTDKDILLSYDVYKDFNKTGYQDWIKADNEKKFGTPGGGDGPIYYPGYVPGGSPVSGGGTPAAVAAEEEESSIPISSVATGPISNQYYIPGASNFYSNLPSNQFDPTTNMLTLADGGRIGYAGGGITDLRQAYGLGKLVKKAFKGIKKVAKSPLGKIGLMALGGWGLKNSGMLSGLKDSSFLKKMLLTGGEGDFTLGNISPWKAISGASALGGLYTAATEKDEEEDGYDYKKLDEWRNYFSGVGDKKNWQSIRGLADGGRIGLKEGLTPRQAALSAMYGENEDEDNMYKFAYGGSTGLPPVTIAPEGFNSQSFPDDETTGIAQATPQNPMPMPMPMPRPQMDPRMMAQQGMPRRMAAEGGLMDLGGMEKDYRAEGGFVPLGGEERADDVPARLSKNEFVFTADAVRNAGGGDIDKGAEVMENLMENLEQGGKVSQGSQGLEGAREMFQTQQRLGEVL